MLAAIVVNRVAERSLDRISKSMYPSASSPCAVTRPAAASLPTIVWVVFIFTVVACVGGLQVFGFQLSGISWFIPLTFALVLLTARVGLIKFPVLIWGMWALFVLVQWLLSDYSSMQRTAQLLSPLVIGAVVSTFRIGEIEMKRFLAMARYLATILLILVIFKTGIYLTGRLPAVTGLASEVMVVLLLCTLFSADYLAGSKKALMWWGIMATIPVIAVTRTAIVAAGLTMPLNLSSMKMKKRILWMVVIGVLGVIVFYTPRVQSKMFKEGEGEMSDVLNEHFSDSGRFYMWERMRARISESPWFGHGTGAGEDFIRRLTDGSSGYPHNDWLLTEYDFGRIGVVLYALTLLAATGHALKRAQTAQGTAKTLYLAGASSFIFYAIMMYTDNIMVYASFFGNLQFTILGLAYATTPTTKKRRKTRVRW